eukprot:CAMPEP_0194219838 /NCGR_PEP_ID=MMETSP0156-20130528/26971_1 /TAXON_ID=33649 /ORGANISM="Thalassionema nitzschioides, Strain L26-B" /LENGTH=374 /DNA_ID=CAMNT_0038949649 /DNA_START=49 /DNA_END=1170 /DNA_ORIENTATION=+
MYPNKSIRRPSSQLLVVGFLLLLVTTAINGLSVTTFNLLAAVHRSVMPPTLSSDYVFDFRESDCESWWRPRAEKVARYIADELATTDVLLLQEWWTCAEYEQLLDQYTGHIFGRVAHVRPGLGHGGQKREDGLAVMINKKSRFQLVSAKSIPTTRGRIAQIVHCREVNAGRSLILGNLHLSFPSSPECERKQAYEALLVARAVAREGRKHAFYGDDGNHLQVIAGDFNSHSQQQASHLLEEHQFCNSMSAKALKSMAYGGGEVDLGVTHRTHLGEDVCVDHVFCRVVQKNSRKKSCASSDGLLQLGYLDSQGTAQVVDCAKKNFCLKSPCKISDHRPVTATIEWDTTKKQAPKRYIHPQKSETNETLHPLQSLW